jgi:hypothetical protein
LHLYDVLVTFDRVTVIELYIAEDIERNAKAEDGIGKMFFIFAQLDGKIEVMEKLKQAYAREGAEKDGVGRNHTAYPCI